MKGMTKMMTYREGDMVKVDRFIDNGDGVIEEIAILFGEFHYETGAEMPGNNWWDIELVHNGKISVVNDKQIICKVRG